MNITSFPELPNFINPSNWIKHGSNYYCYAKDGRYNLLFIWDGFSTSFNKVEIEIDWDYK